MDESRRQGPAGAGCAGDQHRLTCFSKLHEPLLDGAHPWGGNHHRILDTLDAGEVGKRLLSLEQIPCVSRGALEILSQTAEQHLPQRLALGEGGWEELGRIAQ